jgi:lipoate-protein ligase A
MSDPWFLVRSEPGDPAWNMALDEALFEHAAGLNRPILRFYSWSEPAATFGYSQPYHEVEQWTSLRPLVRRLTGGGLVPHDADWTYTLVFPPSHPWYALRAEESYRRLHEWVAAAFAAIKVPAELSAGCAKELPGQCFSGAEKFDVLAAGRKIAGAAQKRNKLGLLIQGSVQASPQNIPRPSWEAAMLQHEGRAWEILELPGPVLDLAKLLAAGKYSSSEHNRRR